MISRDLLDLINSVVPVREHGVVGLPLGPFAAAWVSSTPTIITEATPATNAGAPFGPVAAWMQRPRKSVERRNTQLKRECLRVLRERPGSSIRDVTFLLNRRLETSVPENSVYCALRSLEARGVVRAARLSTKDEKKYGARFLWEAA